MSAPSPKASRNVPRGLGLRDVADRVDARDLAQALADALGDAGLGRLEEDLGLGRALPERVRELLHCHPSRAKSPMSTSAMASAETLVTVAKVVRRKPARPSRRV